MLTKVQIQELYVRQLFIGCEYENCSNFFCKVDFHKSSLHKIASILSEYGHHFICRNQNQTFYHEKSNEILDFYFYVMKNEIPTDKNSNFIEIPHEYCDLFDKEEFTREEQILIEGIFSLILKNYVESDTGTLTNLIIRLFSQIILKIEFKKHTYENISDVFLNIDKLCREIESFDNCEIIKDKSIDPTENEDLNYKSKQKFAETNCKDCLFRGTFNEKDLRKLILRIREYFNTRELTSLRSSKIIEEFLNVFHILFCINEKTKILNFRDFYLEDFCFSQNFREEIKLNKSSNKSLIKYPFILPICLKSEYIRTENMDIMKNKLQDAFFRALFIGETSPYFFITVNRNKLYRDVFKIFMKADQDEIQKEIKITFDGEEGIDSGGITKEFFQLVSDNLMEDSYLFKIQNNVLWFNKEITTKKYEVIGKLVGVALYNDVILNIPFPTFFFKIFLDKKPEFHDLEEIEPEICHSLRQLLQFSEDEIDSLEQTFSITRNDRNINLIPNGQNISVNIHNRDMFVDKYAEFLMVKEMKSNIDGIKRGFLSVIKTSTINFLQPCELEKIIVGCSTINIDKLESTAVYSGFTADFWIIRSFWKIFREYSNEERKRLLMFITGNERVPVGNGESAKIVIIKNGCDTERLPSSQTCFNTLLLPEYSTEEKLRNKLELAISMTKGFFLL